MSAAHGKPTHRRPDLERMLKAQFKRERKNEKRRLDSNVKRISDA